MYRSNHSLTPRLFAALDIVAQCLARKEQVGVFAAFHDATDCVARYLKEAGVPFGIMDGRVNPQARAVTSARFKAKEFPVILLSEASAEGHSFDKSNNVIIYMYSWSPDKIKQVSDRFWRINSVKDVNLYFLVTEGTIDERMASLHQEKMDAAGLVLDGELLEEIPQELNMHDLLDAAADAYRAGGKTVNEKELEAKWPQLRHRLSTAWFRWEQEKAESTKQKAQIQTAAPQSPFANKWWKKKM